MHGKDLTDKDIKDLYKDKTKEQLLELIVMMSNTILELRKRK